MSAGGGGVEEVLPELKGKTRLFHHGDGMNKEQVLRRYAPEQESGADRLQAGLVQ